MPCRRIRRCTCASLPRRVWLRSRVYRRREARRRHGEAKVHAAVRLSRKASCQPPAEGESTGQQPQRFGKRTSQGRFQLAQRVIAAASHRRREEAEEREPVQTQLKADVRSLRSVVRPSPRHQAKLDVVQQVLKFRGVFYTSKVSEGQQLVNLS